MIMTRPYTGCYGNYRMSNEYCLMECGCGCNCYRDTEKGKAEKKQEVKSMSRISKDDYYLDIALAVSKRSTCLKRHYGCVIVKDDMIIATGYNGSPRGEENCCDRGTCQRLDKPHNSGDYSDCCSVHAEQNAMLSASRRDMIGAKMYLAGEEMYKGSFNSDDVNIYWREVKDASPCPICAKMIKNAGISDVFSRCKVEEGVAKCL